MNQIEETMYRELTDEQQTEVQSLVLDKEMSIMEAINSIKNPAPVVEEVKPQTPEVNGGNGEWETTQQIMIDKEYMDQIVAMYLSGRLQMRGATTELHYREYISTSKGHGFRVSGYDRNICIEKRKRVGQK